MARRNRGRAAAACVIALASLGGCGEPPKRMPAAPAKQPAKQVSVPGTPANRATARQERTENPADLLFPHSSGATWEFAEASPGGTAELTMNVRSGTDRAPDTFTVEIRRKGELVMVENYQADEKGLKRISAGHPELGVIQPPMPIIVSPAPDDRRWYWKGEIRYPDQNLPGEARFTVSGPEPVKTAAGSFQAFRIENVVTMTLPSGTRVATTKEWFAPKVGPVKVITTVDGQKTTAELIRYQIPK